MVSRRKRRRRYAAIGMAAATTAALVTGLSPAAASGDKDGPPTVAADDVQFTPGKQLRPGSTRQADLLPEPIHDMKPSMAKYLKPSPDHPLYSGATEIAGRNGVIASHQSAGYALRYKKYDKEKDKATELPRDEWIPAKNDTIYDLASMSKLFTSIAAVQLIQHDKIGLDSTVASYLPDFAQHGKDDITIRNLLTHTSGLPPDPSPSLCDYDTNQERWDAVYATKPDHKPNKKYVYSDLNMMTLQKVIEKVTGKSLDQVVTNKITTPLGLHDTMYNPPKSLKHRIAATEYQTSPDRGMVQGSVHDENAYCLGGVAGHAGVFSTAKDMAVLAQTILNGGEYRGSRILNNESTRSLLTNMNAKFPGNDHGLGFELNQRWYMDGLSSPVTMGHTGFTGPDIVIDPLSHSFMILMTNRVHPTRDWGSNNPARQAVARDFARALPVRPPDGDGWYSGTGDKRRATLALPLDSSARHQLTKAGRATFKLWYDTESTDTGTFEASTDHGKHWKKVPIDLKAGDHSWSTDGKVSGFSGRRWADVSADLPDKVTNLRWRYVTDPLYEGQGIYLNAVRVQANGGQTVFDQSRQSGKFRPHGWAPVRHNGRVRQR